MELTQAHLTVVFSAWAAAQDGNGIVILPEFYREADELAEAGWLRRGFEPDGAISWWWSPRAELALELSGLADVTGRDN